MPVLSQMIDSVLTIADVVESAVGSVMRIVADENEDGTPDVYASAEGYEHAAVIHRPVAESDDGAMETIAWRYGDEMIVVGSRERRWSIQVEEGDVVIRSYGDPTTAGYVHLKPDGEIVVRGGAIKLESSDGAATEGIGLGDAIKSVIDSMINTFNGHTHTDPVSGSTGTPTPTMTPAGSLASTKHTVEP